MVDAHPLVSCDRLLVGLPVQLARRYYEPAISCILLLPESRLHGEVKLKTRIYDQLKKLG